MNVMNIVIENIVKNQIIIFLLFTLLINKLKNNFIFEKILKVKIINQ